jgi:hypothetical protein
MASAIALETLPAFILLCSAAALAASAAFCAATCASRAALLAASRTFCEGVETGLSWPGAV